jgi:signal transduction histidine kinase
MSGGERGDAGARPGRPVAPSRRRPRGSATGAERSVSALIDAVFAPRAEDGDSGATSAADLQSLLAATVLDLARRTAAPRAVAWLDREGGAPWAAASHWLGGGDPPVPDPEAFAALRALPRPTDLGAASVAPPVAALARSTPITCAVAVRADGAGKAGDGAVVLALGSDEDPAGRVRPRTLAMLQAVADRLAGPLATHLAVARLERLDAAVQALDRRASLGDLVAEIVHEVRNPLVSVKTFLQLLPGRLDDPEFLEDFRSVALDEVVRLERLVDSVLQHARPSAEDATRGVAGVGETFEAIVRLTEHRAKEGRVALAWAVEPGVDEVAMARDALRQVVLNLSMNAIDATPAGGRVDLAARAQSVSDGRWVELRITDEGPGIPVAERRRIFDAFYSTRADRVGGLGLAISRRLVEAAGGSIRAGEAPGGGAAITVRLPAAPRL